MKFQTAVLVVAIIFWGGWALWALTRGLKNLRKNRAANYLSDLLLSGFDSDALSNTIAAMARIHLETGWEQRPGFLQLATDRLAEEVQGLTRFDRK